MEKYTKNWVMSGRGYGASRAVGGRKQFAPAEDSIERIVQLYIDRKRVEEIFAKKVRRQ